MTTAELLRKAAEALDKGEDPFNGSFLADNDVTFDQCMTLAENLAIGARIAAVAIEKPRSPQGIAWMMTLAAGTS
jgi:hypothetical protein